MKDQLSALIDGEFELESAEHLITSAKSGGALREAWQHYHLIGDAMRGELERGDCLMCRDFSDRVMQALESENVVELSDKMQVPDGDGYRADSVVAYVKSRTPRFWSVAASVAAVMFVGLMVLQQKVSQPEALAPVEIAQNMPVEYIAAHQAAAPSSAGYYIQTASYNPSGSQK